MYTRGVEHTVEIPLFDGSGDPITTGTVTVEISKDSGVYAAATNTAAHVDEELWTLVLTATEATCDRYRLRVTHDDLPAPLILTDEYPTVNANVVQVGGEAVSLDADIGANVVLILEDTGETLPALIGVEGGTAAEVWAYAARTLTSSASSEGPTAATEVTDIPESVFAGATLGLYCRIRNWDGDDILQADITSIAYTIYLLDDSDPTSATAVTGHSAVALVKTAVIYDTLQTDEWASDYNFKHIPPISANAAFATAGKSYRVAYTITPTSGEKIIVRFKVMAV